MQDVEQRAAFALIVHSALCILNSSISLSPTR
jgi:hypothetical protein